MEKSEQINEIAGALCLAQSELVNATKDSDNPYFKSKYADLAEIINTLKPVFAKNGLSYSQHPSYKEGDVSVTTILMHKSGQWISSCMCSPVVKKDPQGVGSAVTYCRRYSLAAVAGISQEDDDGNEASDRGGYQPGIKKVSPFKRTPVDSAVAFGALEDTHKAADPRTEREKNDAIFKGDDIPDFGAPPAPVKKSKLGPIPDVIECIPDAFCSQVEYMSKYGGVRIAEMEFDILINLQNDLLSLSKAVKTKEAMLWIDAILDEIKKQKG